jgi:hypothetical protein
MEIKRAFGLFMDDEIHPGICEAGVENPQADF